MKVKCDSQMNCVKGTESTTYAMPVDKIACGLEMSVEDPQGAKKALIDVGQEATLKLAVILCRDQTHPDFLGEPGAESTRVKRAIRCSEPASPMICWTLGEPISSW